MKVNVIGTRRLDFDNVKGTQVVALIPPEYGFEGQSVLLKDVQNKEGKFKKLPFVPDSVCASVVPGDYEVSFDINGSIASFVRCK